MRMITFEIDGIEMVSYEAETLEEAMEQRATDYPGRSWTIVYDKPFIKDNVGTDVAIG